MPTPTLRIAIRKFDPFESAIRKQFADFQKATGAEADLDAQAMDLNPLYEELFDREGLRQGRWDIAFLNTDWLALAHQSGALADLSLFLDKSPIADYPGGWAPSLTGVQQIEGGVYGLPYHDGPECLIYRKDLFRDESLQSAYQQRFGRPLRVPETWDDFLTVARFLGRPEEGFYGTVLAAFPDGHNAVYDFCIHLWTRGGELFDERGQPTLATPSAVAALDFYRALAKDEAAVHPNPQQIDSVKSGMLFCEGKIGMMANWFGFAAVGQTGGFSQVKDKVGIAPLPAGPGGKSLSLNVYWVLAIASGSKQPELAYAFLQHVMRPEMDRLATLEGAIGCRRSTWADPEVNRRIPFFNQLDGLHARARQLPADVRFPRLERIIDRVVTKALESDAPSLELLRGAQKEAEDLFAATA